jgi:hypothetical protein
MADQQQARIVLANHLIEQAPADTQCHHSHVDLVQWHDIQPWLGLEPGAATSGMFRESRGGEGRLVRCPPQLPSSVARWH